MILPNKKADRFAFISAVMFAVIGIGMLGFIRFGSMGHAENVINRIIAPISRDEMIAGCSCVYLLRPSDQIIFNSELSFQEAIMNIRGKIVKLTPVNLEQIPWPAKIGDKFAQAYRAGKTNLKFENRISYVCTEKDEGCEVTKFDSELTVSEGNSAEVYQVRGECGC